MPKTKASMRGKMARGGPYASGYRMRGKVAKAKSPSKPIATYLPRVRSKVGSELKNFDTVLAFLFDNILDVASSGVTGQIDLIPGGSTATTRIGRNCTVKQIQLRGRVFHAPTVAGANDGTAHACLWLIQDTQANGAQAAVADFFTSTVVHGALRNVDNAQRFKVLKQWDWDFLSTTVTVAGAVPGSQVKQLDAVIPCSINLEYSAATGAITELRTNHIFLAYGDSINDDKVSFDGTARLLFQD